MPTPFTDYNPAVHQIPFESDRRYSATVVEIDDVHRILLKGSPEVVLSHCNLSDEQLSNWEHESRQLSAKGLRVLAFADGLISESRFEEDSWSGELSFLGFTGLIDPLRPGVIEAIKSFKSAGIDVAMITGDHPQTAAAIGAELGLDEAGLGAIQGDELSSQQDELHQQIQKHRIFARVSPTQKLSIVEALRASGHYVAVTGDGANDAPALKSANIGVTMGEGGTDVAREPAELVITAEILTVGVAIFSGLPLPLLPLQILWLNLVTNEIQDKALAVESAEGNVLARPPRDPDGSILDKPMMAQISVAAIAMTIGTLSGFNYLLAEGYPEQVARSSILMLMVLFQNVHLFNCRSEQQSAFSLAIRNSPWLLAAAITALSIHLLAGKIPVTAKILQFAPIPSVVYAILIPVALSLILVMEIYKVIARRISRRTI